MIFHKKHIYDEKGKIVGLFLLYPNDNSTKMPKEWIYMDLQQTAYSLMKDEKLDVHYSNQSDTVALVALKSDFVNSNYITMEKGEVYHS